LDAGDSRPRARPARRRRPGRHLIRQERASRIIQWYAGRSLPTIATTESILPGREQAAELIPPRGGVTWRISGDARGFSASGYALLPQRPPPSAGAGVTQHSNLKEDPGGRLLRTLDYTSAMVYGGPDLAWEVGRRVREMHKRIKGVRPDGVRYH